MYAQSTPSIRLSNLGARNGQKWLDDGGGRRWNPSQKQPKKGEPSQATWWREVDRCRRFCPRGKLRISAMPLIRPFSPIDLKHAPTDIR